MPAYSCIARAALAQIIRRRKANHVRGDFPITLSELATQTPFRPFVVELVNGERIEVDHPEALAFRYMRAIFIVKEGRAHYFDPEGVNRIIGPEANGSSRP